MAGRDAPPPYAPVQAGPARTDEPPPGDPSAPFVPLNLTPGPSDPQPDTCLAHLKLLFAFQNLKEDVGYTDGLWGLWDTRAEGNISVTEEGDIQENFEIDVKQKDPKEKLLVLSKIREKRWALFVARAVDRYEAWWKALTDGPRLTEDQMEVLNSPSYEDFPKGHDSEYWRVQTLPPLDVLMVFHSHMLNPYNFLEDCLRAGHRSLWRSGMPWSLINSAIDTSFNYNVADDHKARWVAMTGCSWENVDDPVIKVINCPVCSTPIHIPWTTCGLDEHPKASDRPGLIGSGYGDGKLDAGCRQCATRITKEFLSVAKFCKDARDLLVNHYPMPGTVINPTNGEPEIYMTPRFVGQKNPQTFPNRMIQLVLRIKIQELVSKPNPLSPPTMDHVRGMVEDVLRDHKALRDIEQPLRRNTIVRLPPTARLCVRKMMSRYWENFSPFALDLCGAVMRQGIFSEKMCKIDWLHSPTASDTMGRLCRKYKRFLSIMASYPTKVAVPTLDVDLAWHTHQLSPSAYFAYTKTVVRKFVRHDDKIDEDKLQESFEWTSKVYQENHNEVYSECTCWYCESVRTSHISTIGKVLGMSNNEKISEAFHNSGAANLCPPDNSAHMSAHNAVKTNDFFSAMKQRVQAQHSQVHQRRLEENYQKARKRAEKKGRTLPPRDQYYDHWGYSYYMYGPWMYPLYFTPGLYYAWDPGYVGGAGGWASCAAGSCGGGVAAGSCGNSGGCAAGGCGSSAGGCGGGGGGGCGGGGGGGCGGGGGGGGCGGGGGGC